VIGTPFAGVAIGMAAGRGCADIIIGGTICACARPDRFEILSLTPLSDMISIVSTED
jgi:hypothetical protein